MEKPSVTFWLISWVAHAIIRTISRLWSEGHDATQYHGHLAKPSVTFWLISWVAHAIIRTISRLWSEGHDAIEYRGHLAKPSVTFWLVSWVAHAIIRTISRLWSEGHHAVGGRSLHLDGFPCRNGLQEERAPHGLSSLHCDYYKGLIVYFVLMGSHKA